MADTNTASDTDSTRCLVRDIADGALDPAEALSFVADDRFGGIDLFVGRVRRQSHGRAVTGIHYDMFAPLALQVFATAAADAMASHGPALKVYAAHAKGQLAVGDIAVVVAAGSPHRDEAFRACRAVIETIKHQAPIWKREHYVDGQSVWSEGCQLCHNHTSELSPPAAESGPSAHVPATGVVLAGGRSLRMGTDKALLPLEGGTLLDFMLDKLRRAGVAQVIVSGSRPGYLCVPDENPGGGPLAALAALVRALPGQRLLVVPVDMPGFPAAWLERLLAAPDGQPCARFVDQPLPMRLDATPPVLAVLERLLMDEYKAPNMVSIRRMCDELGAVAISAPADGPDASWLNCNTPQQWREFAP